MADDARPMKSHRVKAPHIGEAVVAAMLLLVAAPAALGSEARLVFAEEHGATVNEILLVLPDDLSEVGAQVVGSGRLAPEEGPGVECELFEFELNGSIEDRPSPGFTLLSGSVARTSICDGESRRDVGSFVISIHEFGIEGDLIFSGEGAWIVAEEFMTTESQSSNVRKLISVALVGVAAAVSLAASVICLLKRKRVWFIFGLAVSVLLVRIAIDVANTDLEEGFAGVSLGLLFFFVGAPLAVAVMVGASQPAKPASWWARRRPGAGYELAPPPAGPPSDHFPSDQSG